MLAGDFFTAHQRLTISEAIRQAEQRSRMEISVFVGSAEGENPHAFATQLHNSLVAPSRTVVLMVDPTQRALEIVTGGWVRERISDEQVQGIAAKMSDVLATGDLVGGLIRGIDAIGETAQA